MDKLYSICFWVFASIPFILMACDGPNFPTPSSHPSVWEVVDWSTDIATIKLKDGTIVNCIRAVRSSGTALYCQPTE